MHFVYIIFDVLLKLFVNPDLGCKCLINLILIVQIIIILDPILGSVVVRHSVLLLLYPVQLLNQLLLCKLAIILPLLQLLLGLNTVDLHLIPLCIDIFLNLVLNRLHRLLALKPLFQTQVFDALWRVATTLVFDRCDIL